MNIIDKQIYNNIELLPLDLQGWNSDSKIFISLIQETNPELIIEVGTWKGRSAINMAKYLKDNKLNCKIICVDTWLGALEFWDKLKHTPERDLLLKNGYPQIYYQFLSNVIHNDVQDYILPFPCTSLIAARYFKNNNIKSKLIYIDASHEYEDVLLDLKYFYNILDSNGVLFGDDINNFPGVKQAVQEFTRENNLKYSIIENNYWVIKQ